MDREAHLALREVIEPSPDAPIYIQRAHRVVCLVAAVHEVLATRAKAPTEVWPIIDAAIERTLLEFNGAAEDWLEAVARQQGPALN